MVVSWPTPAVSRCYRYKTDTSETAEQLKLAIATTRYVGLLTGAISPVIVIAVSIALEQLLLIAL